jgi:hypothetical protein
MPNTPNMPNSQPSVIPPFPANCGNADFKDYLEKIYNFAVENTIEQTEWYRKAAKPNRRYAQWLRFAAILFVALAGIAPLAIPMISQGSPGTPNSVDSSKLVNITYIFIGIAAFLIGVDKFFGYSSSWMRYITTQMALETLLAKFRYDWAIESVKACGKLDAEACKPLLTLVKNLAIDVQSKKEGEAAQWATELRNNLNDIENKAVQPHKDEKKDEPNKPPEITNLTANPSSPQSAGTKITWTAEANDPEKDEISYQFLLNGVMVSDWKTDNKWVWTAEKAGSSNKIEVRVIDGNHAGKDGFDAKKIVEFKVNP